MPARYEKQSFAIGDLVYYFGFEVFEPPVRHMGVIIGIPEDAYAEDTYFVFWFESCLTTRIHHDNIILVYEK
jgi:hypothetical protein